ncbi:hypothetical protein EYS14_17085 [Alteromonadaceae bacterium M269]|nr:hypothetical protein EYS14_17085 [Alteromonadaceae bacterium M269]
MASAKFHQTFREYHRWLGFFLSGIMAVYAISGVLLIFRPTDFLKYEQIEIRQLEANLSAEEVPQAVKRRRAKVIEETPDKIILNVGSYDKQTGEATLTRKDYPPVLAKMTKLHKATNNSPLFWLNIAFGIALLFFVLSAFLMFLPRILKAQNSLKIAIGGALFTILVVAFGS